MLCRLINQSHILRAMTNILILCNGEPPSRDLLKKYHDSADCLIAADGGGNIALDMDIAPDVVIGDLDSFRSTPPHAFKIIRRVDQEANDLEKALVFALRKGGDRVHILGATGYRLDHTLKNLSVLKQFNSHFQQISVIDNYGVTRLIPPSFQEVMAIGASVSLFPLSGIVTGVVTSGLQYSLYNETLENGVRDGSSNTVTGSPVEISYREGDLLLFEAGPDK